MATRLVTWMLIGLCGLGYTTAAFGQAGEAPVATARIWTPVESHPGGESACPDCGRLQATDRSLSEHFRQFSKNVVRDFKRNNCWPAPFQRPDRDATRRPFAVSVQAAWERQNLLSDGHFLSDGNLSPSGEYRIRAILTEGPIQHRQIYVRRLMSREETERRVGATREYAVQFVPEGQIPVVEVSTAMPASWSPAAAGAMTASLPAAGGASTEATTE